MTRCPRCSEENPARARFCLGCGLALEPAAASAEDEERRLVTAVFVDLVGSTARGDRRDPEDIRARLVPFHDRVRGELELFGGTVEKFIGDAVVALFGAPIGHEDDPERAVRAAFAVRDAVDELTAEDAWLALDVRIGVATGEALVRPRAWEGDALAIGDVMNTASRIQAVAPPGEIVVCAETFRATEHAVDYRPLEPLTAKGKRDPLPVWQAVALKTASARRRSNVPLVGRRRELAALGHQWRRVRADGAPATVLVLAPPGTGKTRVLAAFCEQLDTDVFWGRCLAYGEGGAYAAVAEILAAAGAERLAEDALLDPEERRTVSASLDALLGPAAGAAAGGEITRGELHWGIRRVLELAAREAIAVVFEDVHWADPALLDLLAFIEEADAPILVLCSARPEFAAGEPAAGQSGLRRLVLDLPPLTRGESETLAAELLGASADHEGMTPILEAAQGNPLFIEETVRMLADRRREPTDGPGPLPLPPSLRSMIGARLDRLPEPQKHLALRASVVGSSFWPGAIAVLNGSVDDLEGALERLAVFDVAAERPTSTVRGEREFAFKHDLIREVAYERLPKGLRAELHLRCADWFASRQERDEFAEVHAYHLEQACRLARAIERSPVAAPTVMAAEALRIAAEKAERREGLQEADRLYARALELVGDEHPAVAAELRLRRARVLTGLGELDEACGRFRSVAADAATVGWAGLRGAALVGLGNALQKQGRGEEARLALVDAKAIAEETGDTRLEVQALFELASLHRDFFGRISAAVEEAAGALELAAGLGDRQLLAEGELRMGFLLYANGQLAQAEQALARSAEIGSELGSRRDESRATFLRAFTAFHRGRPEEAEKLALEAQSWFERTGDSYFRIQGLRSLATYARARGDAGAAERYLREALELARPSGGWLVSDLTSGLAELLAELGRADEASEAAAAALATAPEDDPAARGVACVAAACAAAAGGDAAAVRARAEEALEILVPLGNALELARTRIVVAGALAAVGETARASTELELAGEECARMGATTLLAEAEIALADLERAGTVAEQE